MSSDSASWDPSKLVRLMHGLPHRDFHFHNVPSNQTYGAGLDPSDKAYYESLLLYGVAIAALGVLLALVYGLAGCLVCCCCSGRRRGSYEVIKSHSEDNCCPPPVRRRCSLCFIGIFATLAIGSAVCALYPCLHLNQNISTAVDGVNDMATAFNHSRQNVAQLSTLSSYGESQAVQLVDQLRRMGAPQNVIDDASEMEQNLTMVAIGASSTEGQVPVLNVHKYTHDVKHINHYRSIAEYSVLGVFAIVGLVFFSLVVCGNRCGACTSLLLGVIILVLAGTATGAYFVAARAVADACYEPTEFVLHYNDPYDQDILRYYLYCNDTAAFPFAEPLAELKTEIGRFNSTVASVREYLQPSGDMTYVNEVANVANQIARTLPSLAKSLECADYHADYNSTLHAACGEGMEMTFVSLCLKAAVFLCFIILVPIVMCLYNNPSFGQEYEAVIIEERRPLLSQPAAKARSVNSDNTFNYDRRAQRRWNEDY